MGLLDSVLSQVLGGAQGGAPAGGGNNADLLQAIVGMLGNDAPGQLGQVLGPEVLSALTRQTGGQSGDVLGQLTQPLPHVIDQLTPHGRVPASGLGNTSDLVGMLGPR